MNSIQFWVYSLILIVYTATNEGRQHEDIDYFALKSGIQKASFSLEGARNGNYHMTNLDDGRDLWLLVRRILLKNAAKNWQRVQRKNREQGKLQITRKWEEFPCKLNGTRSSEPPTSVDRLRPGDIDVVAAIGDSLSAGNGVNSESSFETYAEFRGMAFSGGGMADWRTLMTLPNILKVFNPNLYGFSTAHVLAVDKESYLNIAEPMLLSRDMVYQVQVIIERMKRDPRIDMRHHWKLLTIFVGANDFCTDMCQHDNLWEFLRRHERDLRDALSVLRYNVPRLIVNLLPPPNVVQLLRRAKNLPVSCGISQSFSCSCLVNRSYSEKYLQKAFEFITRWQAIDEHIASSSEFQSNDFAILYQSFTANLTMPTKANGDADLRYFGRDCFHFSQLGHASAANILWNNMLQAPGQKESDIIAPFERFECPTAEKPYIATLRNSFK